MNFFWQGGGLFAPWRKGKPTITGNLNVTEASDTIAATGTTTPPFDPSTLALTGWWRDFVVTDVPSGRGALSDVASAGPSGSRPLSGQALFNEPKAGAVLNGHTSARFATADNTSLTALTWADFVGTGGAWTVSCLLVCAKVQDTLGDPGTDTPNNDSLCGDTNPGFIGGALVSSEPSGLVSASVNAYAFSSGFQNSGVTAFIALGTPMKIQFGYDGVNYWSRVNGELRTSSGPQGFGLGLTRAFLMGNAGVTPNTRNLNADMFDFLIIDQALSNTVCDEVNSYYHSEYGV
jgi:hypothetical protein